MPPTHWFRLISFILAMAGFSLAQAPGKPCDTLCSKRAEIAQYADIEHNPAVTADLKSISSQRLHAARAQLRDLLQQNIQVALTLLAGAPEGQRKALQDKLTSLKDELASVEVALSGPAMTHAAADADPRPAPLQEPAGAPATSANPAPAASNPGAASTTPASSPSPAGAPPNATEPCSGPEPVKTSALYVLANGIARTVVEHKDPNLAFGQLEKGLFLALADKWAPPSIVENANTTFEKLFVKSETRRDDKQLDAPTGAGNALIEKPSFARLLGFAIEQGGVQQQVSGTSLTLSSSPYALFSSFHGGDTGDAYRRYAGLTRLGASASFDIQNSNDVLASANRKQLREWTVRYRFSPDRTTRSKDFEKYWTEKVLPALDKSGLSLNKALAKTLSNSKLTETINDRDLDDIRQYYAQHKNEPSEDAISGLTDEIVCRLQRDVVDNFSVLNKSDQESIGKALDDFTRAQVDVAAAVAQADDFGKQLQQRWQSSFTYSQTRQEVGSDYSTFKFIYEKGLQDPFKLTANVAASLYHNPDGTQGQETLRNFSAALAFDLTAGHSPFVTNKLDESQISISFTGSYERMPENARVAGQKADIGMAQFKISLPVTSGLSFPLSVTYANASELVHESFVRANFGLTFDMDKLTQLIRGAKLQ